MSALSNKCLVLIVPRKILKTQTTSCSSKKWPDDKWIIMNNLRRLGNWWQSKLNGLDAYCGCLRDTYPNMPPPTESKSKLDIVKDNLSVNALKYWSARTLCTTRRQILTIQAMDWHVATHNFIMTNIRKSIASTKSYLEQNLIDEVDLPKTKNDSLSQAQALKEVKIENSCSSQSANLKQSEECNKVEQSKTGDCPQ